MIQVPEFTKHVVYRRLSNGLLLIGPVLGVELLRKGMVASMSITSCAHTIAVVTGPCPLVSFLSTTEVLLLCMGGDVVLDNPTVSDTSSTQNGLNWFTDHRVIALKL